jgi:hypothetical protein
MKDHAKSSLPPPHEPTENSSLKLIWKLVNPLLEFLVFIRWIIECWRYYTWIKPPKKSKFFIC